MPKLIITVTTVDHTGSPPHNNQAEQTQPWLWLSFVPSHHSHHLPVGTETESQHKDNLEQLKYILLSRNS